MAAHSLEYFEFYKHPNESKILRTFFGNHCKISERRTESFFTLTSKWNLGCQRTQEWGLQSLAVQPPTWQAVRKPKAWELGTYVLFNLVGQLLLCIADQKNQWDTTWNQSSYFFRNNWCPCLHRHLPQRSADSRLLCPTEMWYATPPHPLPVPCLCPKIWILEASSPISWLLGAEWISWQENTQISAWQT